MNFLLLPVKLVLTHLLRLHPYSTSQKYQKIFEHLMFLEGRDRLHWKQMS